MKKNVRSMFIKSAAFNDKNGTLTVRMRNGKGYNYYGFTKQKFTRLLNAESVGQYYGRKIRGQYAMRRLKTEKPQI